MTRLVSVIVLNFNGEDHLDECLRTLTLQTYPRLQIIVADNGSTDRSLRVVEKYPVEWHAFGRNYGFATGNNVAVRFAEGEVLVFVNNDMRFHPRFVEALAAPIVDDTSVFATDAVQLNWKGDAVIHGATRIVRRRLSDRLGRGGMLPTLDIEQSMVPVRTDEAQACAANMAVRREMFEALNGFDGRFPASWEDTDICWRAWLRGWRTVFVPEAVAWHKVGQASRSAAGARVHFLGTLQGRLLFATKHLPWPDIVAVWSITVLGLGKDLLRARGRSATGRFRGLLGVATMLPSLLRERRALYGIAERTPREHLEALIGLPPLGGTVPPGRCSLQATTRGCTSLF